MKIKKIKNFDMNKNTYALRRKVINLIYEVKNSGVNLPRIEVRIGEPRKQNLLGVLYLKIIKSGLQMMLSKWVKTL